MGFEKIIKDLKRVDLSKVSYTKLFQLFLNSDFQVPFTTVKIHKGEIIERGRIKENNTPYSSEKEISYRTDIEKIIKFGRANKPHSSLFYGSIPTKELEYARVAIFTELCPEYRQTPVLDMDKSITIGQWEVVEDFEIADIVFSEKYEPNSRASRNRQYWEKKIQEGNENSVEHLLWLTFFAEQFAKELINTDDDYKLSTVYTDMAIYIKKLSGVLYPSVRTNYLVDNIVLHPSIVEKHLKLKKVGVFRLKSKDGKGDLEGIAFTDQLGPLNSNFNWKYKNK